MAQSVPPHQLVLALPVSSRLPAGDADSAGDSEGGGEVAATADGAPDTEKGAVEGAARESSWELVGAAASVAPAEAVGVCGAVAVGGVGVRETRLLRHSVAVGSAVEEGAEGALPPAPALLFEGDPVGAALRASSGDPVPL